MQPFHIWNGVFGSFAEAGGSAGAFAESRWVTRSKDKARALRRAPWSDRYPEYCLPPLAAAAQIGRPFLRVLDFGGSVGFVFPSVAASLGRPGDFHLSVVDNEAVCAAGREVFAGEQRISFQSAMPEGPFDIVHLGSSIQYVDDWVSQVRALTRGGPEFLLFDDVPAGDIHTFVSLQRYYDREIPHWFFGLEEFLRTVTEETGYELFYRARFLPTVLGKAGPLPMDNLPPERQITHTYNLGFVRKDRAAAHTGS